MTYNVNFKNVAEFLKLNNMTEEAFLAHMKRYFENQNYRNGYNKRKNALLKQLSEDPVVQKRVAELKKNIK